MERPQIGVETLILIPILMQRGAEGGYSNSNPIGRIGFDRRGLALYSVYQGTGGAVTLPTSTVGAQYSDASIYGGSYISLSSLQPGDLVFFGSSSSAIDHVGIAVSGTGTSALIITRYQRNTGSLLPIPSRDSARRSTGSRVNSAGLVLWRSLASEMP